MLHLNSEVVKNVPRNSAVDDELNHQIVDDTHIIIIILYGLSCEVEHSPRYDTFTNEVTDFEVSCQNCL